MLIDFFFKTSSCVNLCLPKPPSQSLFQVLPELVLGGRGFPGDSDSKESTCSVGDLGSIPGLGRSPVGTHGNPCQYSCLANLMDMGAWQATVHGVTKSQTRLNS